MLPAWALQGLGSLLAGLWLRNQSDPTFGGWTRAGLVLALAAGVRGFASNLPAGGEGVDHLALPVGVLGLLGGYVALNRLWHREPEAGGLHQGLGLGLHRMPWFAVQAILLFGFLWVEASGTELTVWLSSFGLGMVVLGFALAERVARRTGLGILTLCILKLFLYDLRGLEGLARVASFLVLGLVLIAVSFAYTRFKDRVL